MFGLFFVFREVGIFGLQMVCFFGIIKRTMDWRQPMDNEKLKLQIGNNIAVFDADKLSLPVSVCSHFHANVWC